MLLTKSVRNTGVFFYMTKNQLKTEIEKTFHKLVADEIKEQVVDFTVLYVQKNRMEVDRASMSQVLEIVRLAIDDSYYKNIDKCLNALEPTLEEFVSDTNPLAHT